MIYLDNGATSFPKPQGVYEGVEKYLRYCGASSGRSAHKRATEAMEIATGAREMLANLFGISDPEKIIFTKNATEGLNTIILGMVKEGDKAVVSHMEHNSVMRPLAHRKANIEVLPVSEDGTTDMEALRKIGEGSSLVIINHVSNVSGAVNDIEKAGEICKDLGVPLLIDVSQSAGHFNINAEKIGASIAFPGHKGLLGPQGTGGMYLHNINPPPLTFGGTGSDSESIIQPISLPNYYESGTLNMAGIWGLYEGLKYIFSVGIDKIAQKEALVTEKLKGGLKNIKGAKVIGENLKKCGAVVSFTLQGKDPSEISFLLDEKYDIASRSGLHCAPLAHRLYGTEKGGTVRLSPGFFTTEREIDIALEAIESIVKNEI